METGGEDEAGDAAPTRESVLARQQLELRNAIQTLQNMCIVLGVDFNKKLQEMGATSVKEIDDISRVNTQVEFLHVTIEANFDKCKILGRELMEEWELSQTGFGRMVKFAHIISVADSTISSDVVDASFLDTLWLKRAQTELENLRKERKAQAKKEYEKLKKNLTKLVSENHISWEKVGFNPKDKVYGEKYDEASAAIQKYITMAKELACGRRELVFRVELVKKLIQEKSLPVDTMRGFLKLAQKHVEQLNSADPIMYDGDEVKTVLGVFSKELDTLEVEQQLQRARELRMQSVRTRNGSSPTASPDDSSSDEATE